MQPKKIKACGKLKPEFQVETKERDSVAARMAIDGISNTPEYIAFVDKQVSEGTWTDAVTQEIRARISDSYLFDSKLRYLTLTSAITAAAHKLAFKAFSDELAGHKLEAREKYVKLTKQEEKEVNIIMRPILEDASRECVYTIDKVLGAIRKSVMKKFKIEPLGDSSNSDEPGDGQFCIDTNSLEKKPRKRNVGGSLGRSN